MSNNFQETEGETAKKVAHTVIGFLVILMGAVLLNITVDSDGNINICFKISGILFIGCGILYLKKSLRLEGNQRNGLYIEKIEDNF